MMLGMHPWTGLADEVRLGVLSWPRPGAGYDPDRISFVKVLEHVRRSVIRQSAQTSAQIRQFMAMLAAKVRRKLDNGARCLREADRCLKRPASKYSFRTAGQVRRPTRRVAGQGAH